VKTPDTDPAHTTVLFGHTDVISQVYERLQYQQSFIKLSPLCLIITEL